MINVAPARERGLKCLSLVVLFLTLLRRSRKGAWIEIAAGSSAKAANRRRSRKGAWIEIALSANYNLGEGVAPARERGLKCNHAVPRLKNLKSLPQGSVD